MNNRRATAIRQSEIRRAEVEEKNPVIREIDRRMAATGRELFRIACEGGNDMATRIDALKAENQRLQDERKAALAEMGLPEDYTEVHYTCEDCGDTGFVNSRMCSCMHRALVEEGFRSSGVSGLLERQSFQNFSLDYYRDDQENWERMRILLEKCKAYAADFRPGKENLLLLGGTGLGKTHLSTAIAREVIEKGYDVVYENAPNLFSDFEYDRFKSRGEGDERSKKHLTAELLILDDLGSEMPTAFTVACLYNLLNTRQNRGLSTIISSNLSHGEISSRYDDRITSRLFGEFTVFLLQGKDIRMQRC